MAQAQGFDAFVLARSPAVLRTAYLLVRDESLAEDLLQTALTKAWFAWKRIDGDPEPYLRRILVTTSVTWWRRRWTIEVPAARLPERAASADPSIAEQDLWTALGHLPRRQRAVVVLRYLEDRSWVETADLLECSVGTVKSQCAKALAKLRVDATFQPITGERVMNLSDLQRAAEHADSVQGNSRTRLTDVHLRIRAARQLRTVAVAGALAVAIGLGGAAVNGARQAAPVISPAGTSSVPSPSFYPDASWCQPSPTAPPAGRVGFLGLPPEGAVPSSITGAPLVLEWFGDDDGQGKSNVWLFADGRLIVEREAKLPQGANDRQTGYLERCLSPAGVESLRRFVIEEGLILTDEPPYPAWLRVRAKDDGPLVDFGPLIDFDPLAIDEQRLLEPETWLHESDWSDKRYRPYVPTTYSLCSSVPPPLVDSLPPAVASLLRSRTLSVGLSPAETCATLTTDEARHVVEMLENEWFRSDYDGPRVGLDVGLLPHRETSNVTASIPTVVRIMPVLPDGQFTCNCG